MREQALYPKRKPVEAQDRRMSGIIMARVRDVDPATGLLTVEMVDGAVVFEATCMALHANGTSGWLWLPQEGDLVVLAFLQGRKALPVVLGSLYATKDPIPTPDPDVLEIKHQSGTTIRLEKNGDVHLAHVTGATVDVDDKAIVLQSEAGGPTETFNHTHWEIDCGGALVRINRSNGDVRIQHPNGPTIDLGQFIGVNINANGCNISVGPGGNVDINATGDVALTGGTVHVGGTTAVVLDGDHTGPQIGSGSSHTHQIIAGSTVTKGG